MIQSIQWEIIVRRNLVILDTQPNFLKPIFSAHVFIYLTKFNRFFKLSLISVVALSNQTYYKSNHRISNLVPLRKEEWGITYESFHLRHWFETKKVCGSMPRSIQLFRVAVSCFSPTNFLCFPIILCSIHFLFSSLCLRWWQCSYSWQSYLSHKPSLMVKKSDIHWMRQKIHGKKQ